MKILHVQAQLPAKTGSGVYFSNVIKGFKYKYEQACVFATLVISNTQRFLKIISIH